MKFLQIGVAMFLPMFLSGCLYGQCFDGPCALEHERILNSIKAYGEYFEKPGMTKESWRADWLACGGRENGGFFVEPRQAEDKDDFANVRRKTNQLSTCMQSKGYEYRNVPLPAK